MMSEAHDAIALFDLDGTLADYDGAMKKQYRELCSDQELALMGPDFNPSDIREGYVHARTRRIRNTPNFWFDLPRYQAGFEVLKIARELEFEIHALTKGPKSNAMAWAEKVLWCQKHVPDFDGIHIGQKKSLVYGKVLVDDWPGYYMQWLEVRPRGLVVVPAHPWNEGHTSHPNIVRYDGANLNEVRERMQIQRESANK
jgi:5'-nucleotidase